MAPRANWKGELEVSELKCSVKLFTAVSSAERLSFRTINRKTGHALKRIMVDEETGEELDSHEQAKGFDSDGKTINFEQKEIADVVPEADKTLQLTQFVSLNEVPRVVFDKPYYLAPAEKADADIFSLIAEGLQQTKCGGIASVVLFRRFRYVLIYPDFNGLIAMTLHFHDEIKSSNEVFKPITSQKSDPEMLDLAQHIIDTKRGQFNPAGFADRYEQALISMVKAKIAGKSLPRIKPKRKPQSISLLEALKKSAKAA